jgi:hypothetical protein
LFSVVSTVAFVCTAAVALIWASASINLFSMGDVEESFMLYGRSFVLNKNVQRLFIYMVFGLLWITAFIAAVSQMTVAFVVAHWFFSPRDADGRHLTVAGPIRKALAVTFKYHLGFLAFGFLLLAIVWFIRVMIEYT